MEEIEYGEFLRLEGGKIVRYGEKQDIRVENNRYIDYSGEYEWETRIVKHSKNIIDLIEVGDYVNGILVTNIVIETDYIPEEKSKRRIFVNRDTKTIQRPIEVTKIKSIVTKEQFENVEYDWRNKYGK